VELSEATLLEAAGNDGNDVVAPVDPETAIRAAFVAAGAEPASSLRWAALGDVLRAHGDRERAPRAYARSLTASLAEPALLKIIGRLRDGDFQGASSLLEVRLRERSNDVAGLRLRGELSLQTRRFEAAEGDFRKCLDYVATDRNSRFGLTMALFRQARFGEALEQADTLLHLFPDDAPIRGLKATLASTVGDYAEALALQTGLAVEKGDRPRTWLDMGHTLRMVGRTQESIRAYHRAIGLKEDCGEAWWELANLKTYRFEKSHLDRMAELAAGGDLDIQSRIPLLFAVGKALEDEGKFERSFESYAQGNALKRSRVKYSAERHQRLLDHLTKGFVPSLVETSGQGGGSDSAPIFVVGMPRSGSTLVEQVLASHPMVEGTMEIPYMEGIAHRLMSNTRFDRSLRLADRVQSLSLDQRRALGSEYLSHSLLHRRLRRPHFVDKLPANFAHIGLIRAILPEAKIIDVRRGGMATCFSLYKQLFAHGQEYSYDLEDIAHYYRAYTGVMARFGAADVGGICQLQYESLVTNPQEEIARLLAFLNLPFDSACLRPEENRRPVRTPSSEQVRQPITSSAVEHWKNFEPWLAPAAAILANDRE